MQQDAIRRAREMHSRATSAPRSTAPQERRSAPVENNRQEPPPPPAQQPHMPQQDILASLFKDKDKTIILALLLLLSGENGDNSLLYALMYLLM